MRSPLEFRNVRRIGVQDAPADTGGNSRARDLRKSGTAYRFKNDGGGTKQRVGLDSAENLRALRDGIAIGVDNFEFGTNVLGSGTSRGGLFDLVVVILRSQRKQEAESLHPYELFHSI